MNNKKQPLLGLDEIQARSIGIGLEITRSQEQFAIKSPVSGIGWHSKPIDLDQINILFLGILLADSIHQAATRKDEIVSSASPLRSRGKQRLISKEAIDSGARESRKELEVIEHNYGPDVFENIRRTIRTKYNWDIPLALVVQAVRNIVYSRSTSEPFGPERTMVHNPSYTELMETVMSHFEGENRGRLHQIASAESWDLDANQIKSYLGENVFERIESVFRDSYNWDISIEDLECYAVTEWRRMREEMGHANLIESVTTQMLIEAVLKRAKDEQPVKNQAQAQNKPQTDQGRLCELLWSKRDNMTDEQFHRFLSSFSLALTSATARDLTDVIENELS